MADVVPLNEKIPVSAFEVGHFDARWHFLKAATPLGLNLGKMTGRRMPRFGRMNAASYR
jgi:hypothetical protein